MINDKGELDHHNAGKVAGNGNGAPAASNGNANGHTNGNGAPAATPAEKLERAKGYAVPTSVPLAGQTLGAAMKDAKFGVAVLKFLAGKAPNQAGDMYVPATEEDKKVVAAAGYILDSLPQGQ